MPCRMSGQAPIFAVLRNISGASQFLTWVVECRLRQTYVRSVKMALAAASNRTAEMATKLDQRIIVAAPAILIAAIAAWLLYPTFAETEPDLSLNAAISETPENLDDRDIAAPPRPLASLPDAAELSRLRLSRQSFRRGGLGSRALMIFTVRNANDYDVKDLEILCAFRSRDGRYTTERRRVIPETISMKSRKAFPMTPMGFVNIRAEKAKCSLITASRA